MTVMTMHDNDVSNLYVGKLIRQGEVYFEEGTRGNTTGNHIHITAGKGKFTGNGWYKNSYGSWCINNQYDVHKALFLSDKTIIKNNGNYNWIKTSTLKEEENKRLDWSGKRQLSSLNYLLQTDAIKKNIIKVDLKPHQISFIYASEADVINVALFGVTANEWKQANPNQNGNIRDFANVIELTILSNLELLNSKLIEKGISQSDRLVLLNEEANKEKLLFTSYKPKLLQ